MGAKPNLRQLQPAADKLVPPPMRPSPAEINDRSDCRAPGTAVSRQASLTGQLSITRDTGEYAEHEPVPRQSTISSLWARLRGLTGDWADTQRTPAMLISLIAHIALFLMLALLSLTPPLGDARVFDFTVVGQTNSTNAPPLLAVNGDFQAAPALPIEELPMAGITATAIESSDGLSELINAVLGVDSPTPPGQLPSFSAARALAEILYTTSTHFSAVFASTGIEGRRLEQRRQTALARGGSLQSEEAIERALQWLATHQLPSGGWSLVHDGGTCNGRCGNPGSPERFDPAATGLSLLAFLGAGYTHKEGKHRETVRRGVYFLLQIMEDTPQGGSFLYRSERGMYNHGIAAFAVCEAYQLTKDRDLKRAAQQAVDFIVSAQNYQGGWGYLPKQPGDLTLSGWQLMALKSAYAAGLDVPPSTIFRVDPFLDSQQTTSTFFYGYRGPGDSPTCTAIALLLRLFRGKSHTDPSILGGADYFRQRGLAAYDVYYNYYATLLLFHIGPPFFPSWNEPMREHLIRTQAQTGHEAGSWYFEDAYGREGGRLYTTAMCAMTLEVYYRFSPIYQQTDVKFEL